MRIVPWTVWRCGRTTLHYTPEYGVKENTTRLNVRVIFARNRFPYVNKKKKKKKTTPVKATFVETESVYKADPLNKIIYQTHRILAEITEYDTTFLPNDKSTTSAS